MATYMIIKEGTPVGHKLPRPQRVLYTDPTTAVKTEASAVNMNDAELLAIAGYARVDPAYVLPPYNVEIPGGTFDEETGLATPNYAPLSIAAVRSKARAAVQKFADELRASTADGAGPYEIAAWPVKAERAARILAETASAEDTAIVQAEATARDKGETVAELAAIQQAKAHLLATAVSIIDGQTNAVQDDIQAATELDEPDTLVTAYMVAVQVALAALLGGA